MTSTPSGAESAVIEALERMRSGIPWMFAGMLLIFAGILWMFAGMLLAFARFVAAILTALIQFSGPPKFEPAMLVALVPASVLGIVGILVSLAGLYARFVPGASQLGRVKPGFGTVAGLIRVGYLGGLILVLVGLAGLVISAVLLSSPTGMLAWGAFLVVGVFLAAGVVLLLVGWIGVIALCFELHGAYRSSLYLVAGILMILIIIPSPFLGVLLGLIAWILLYMALGDTVRELRALPTS